ncbi:hypothetical protein QFZ28_003994 [Neobacillus niacini]|uniref:hypothetical protein n=1 Tax=Neobacillus niacini TaxID=86668 RepID=UPI002782E3AA|nr:hypothetical protein [Neobacillus niacini]MDQ1003594.1 hypothetical protein [Neobacillus niacini]
MGNHNSGCEFDAISSAAQFGIYEGFTVDYNADKKGTEINYEFLNEVVMNFQKEYKIDRS